MNRKIGISLYVTQTVLLLISIVIAISLYLPYLKQYRYLTSLSYDHIYEYSNDSNLHNSYYLLNGVLLPRFEHGSKAEALMQKDTDYNQLSPFSDLPRLSSTEVAVTSNILETEKIAVGDSITVFNPLNNAEESYLVAYVMDANYGLLCEEVDKRYGVIIFGENNSISENYDLSSIVFADPSFSASQNQLMIDEMYSKSHLVEDCRNKALYYFVTLVVFDLVIIITVFIVFEILTSQRLRKLVVSGASNRTVARFINKQYCVMAEVSVLVANTIAVMYSLCISGGILLILILFVLCALGILILSSLARFLAIRRTI